MLRAWPKPVTIALALLLTVLLGVMDYLTGSDIEIEAFYLLPIAWATWVTGRNAGLLVATVSALASLVSDLKLATPYAGSLIPYWNALMLLGLFVVMVFLLTALQTAHANLEGTVAQRTTQLRAEIAQHQAAETARLTALRRLADAQETERAHISRELHDQFGQELTALKLGLQLIRREGPDSLAARRTLEQLTGLADRLILGVQRLAWELRPATLDDFGLEVALRRYTDEWAEQTGVPVDFHSAGLEDRRMPGEFETVLYRVAQAALTNVARHAQARHVSVLAERKAGRVSLIVEDDGCGFDAEAALKTPGTIANLGLRGIQERVMLAGGTVEIESTPGAGTTILVRLPLAAETAKKTGE